MKTDTFKHYFTGVLATLTTIVLFASFVIASRAGLKTQLSPSDLTALRFVVAGTLLLPVFLRQGFMGLTFIRACALAFFGGLGFAFTAYSAFKLAPASHGSALLHGTLPLTTLVLQTVLGCALPERKRLIPVLLISAGVALMVFDSLHVASHQQLLGDALLLLASIFWSAYGICVSKFRVPAIPAAATVAVLSGAAFLPVYVLSGAATWHKASVPDVVMQMFIQGLLVGVIANIAYLKAIANLGAPAVALALAIVPSLTVIAAIGVLGEWPTLFGTLAIALVTAGILAGVLQFSQAPTVASEHLLHRR